MMKAIYTIKSRESACASTAKALLFLLVLTLLSASGCKPKTETGSQTTQTTLSNDLEMEEGEVSVARPIVYEVIIKPHEGLTDWEKEMVTGFQGWDMIRDLIEKVFEGEIQAYDYFTEKPMDKKQLQMLKKDPEFGARQIGRLQFTENWFYDEHQSRLRKQIHKVVFGYEDRDEQDQVLGYKAAFFIYMNSPSS